MTSETLYLLDISSYIYRAFHAIRGLTNSQGLPTNAAFGVTSMLLKVLRDRQPHYLALLFDSKAPTFRHREYADYKAHRPPMPDDLVRQLPFIQKIIEGLNLPRLEMPGFEADDLIATLVGRARAQGLNVEIVSGDKDLLPLVQEGVVMWDPMKNVRFDSEAIHARYGVTPAELVEVKALAGDPSDNIPGVPGIGEKTALRLITQYHTLENLLAHINDIKEKGLRAKLTEHADQARLSHRLVLLAHQVPLEVDLETLRPGPPDRESLRRLFLELEFSRFNQELGVDAPPAGAFQLVTDRAGLEQLAESLAGVKTLGVYILLGDQHPVMAEVGGLALSWRPGRGGLPAVSRRPGPGAHLGGPRPRHQSQGDPQRRFEGGPPGVGPVRPGAARGPGRHPPGLLPAEPRPLRAESREHRPPPPGGPPPGLKRGGRPPHRTFGSAPGPGRPVRRPPVRGHPRGLAQTRGGIDG